MMPSEPYRKQVILFDYSKYSIQLFNYLTLHTYNKAVNLELSLHQYQHSYPRNTLAVQGIQN